MSLSAIFAGSGTLLINCVEEFRARGGHVLAILTTNSRIETWANDQGIAVGGTPTKPAVDLPRGDYFFSVANLEVLPEDLLSRAGKMAINFHDGPLPERAGLNVPAWAIFEGASTHAVTWHEMTAKVDAGRVLKTSAFEIRPTDTAFSLNARCYEVGLGSFRSLLDDLFADRLRPVAQTGPRGWYGRAKRPVALGCLDFAQAADRLDRTVRALNFGGYENPLSTAKLWTGTALVNVGALTPAQGQAAAGAVISVTGDGAVIATADGAVQVSALTDMTGQPVSPDAAGLAAGMILPALPVQDGLDGDAIGKAEADWQRALLAEASVLPPYPQSHNAAAQRVGLSVQASSDVLRAAWIAWLAGLTGRDKVACGLAEAPRAPWLSAIRPIVVDMSELTAPEAAVQGIGAQCDAAMARAPMAADLPLRSQQSGGGLPQTAIAETDAGAGAADLVLVTGSGELHARAGVLDGHVLQAIADDFCVFLSAWIATPDAAVSGLPLGRNVALDICAGPAPDTRTVHGLISDVARATPEEIALEAGDTKLTYAQLDQASDNLAGALAAKGARRGTVVGLCLERSADLVIAMLAILKTGAAYVPIDPDYPADRVRFVLEDCKAELVVASPATAAKAALRADQVVNPGATGSFATANIAPDDLAYLIYTSGSTGKPKGVMVSHGNVTNFFAGMDDTIPFSANARLLGVTSVSFDISVLEILWTLSHGATLVLQTDPSDTSGKPDFSLFYFASEAAGTGHQAYRLLLEGAKFADKNGFEAIWTPERHFHAFGGLYPNPAISSAALSGITKNVKLRAGSSVLPLHHPVRVAEDWALVDNLSNGRAGVAIASGWQPNDFLMRPESFQDRKDIMLDSIDTLRALWRGEEMSFPGHDGEPVQVAIHPRPMQDEIPLWLTAAGNPETFVAAGRKGCGVLTHLLGQTVEELSEKIAAYRMARAEAGFEGPGHIVLMLHTFIAETEEEVLAAARGPMKQYLKSAVDLVRKAAWSFPTIVERAGSSGETPQQVFEKQDLSPEELDALLDHAFERYYHTAGLFGTPESAREIVRKVAAIGIDEVACLIDFGIDTDVALENLPNIKRMMDGLSIDTGPVRQASVAEEIVTKNISHLQCTPSMAAYLAADQAGQTAVAKLDCLMVGGEAFPPDLARALRGAMTGDLFNMYGPTETTIWSSVAKLDAVGDQVPLGAPIANTSLSVRSPGGQALPDMAEGELWIGGVGVARGYWERPDLTAERFVTTDQGRFYRTGDLVRRKPGGGYDFLGRIDHQVKIRGHRIELGEIEACLTACEGVREAVVLADERAASDVQLVAYVTAGTGGVEADALSERIAAQLPDYMRPSHIQVLDTMPLTPNGKVDRKALPSPSAPRVVEAVEAAEGDLETRISEIWAQALGHDQISVTGNFFDMGGHSLLVVQVQRRMQEALGRDIALTDLFRFPSVRAIANHLSEHNSKAPSAANRGTARAAARRNRRLARSS